MQFISKLWSKIKKLFEPTDMTVGTPWKSIALFSVPMIIGNIAQQLYSTVDSIVVGRYIGDNALAAVGSAAPLVNLLMVLFVGISAGVSIMVAQYFGAKSREDLSHTIGTCITLIGIVSIFLMIVLTPFARPMLEMLDTPEALLDDCTLYLQVCIIGVAGMGYYNILTGILRGMGDSFSGLIYLLIATVINVVLDIWFVAGFGMGVYGVAIATVIAQLISSVFCLMKLLRMREIFDLGWAQLKMSKRHVAQIVKLGLPSGATQAIMSSAMIIVQSLTNSFGEQFIAANVIVMRVDGFAMMPNFSFGMAMTTFVGQNVGARKFDRVRQGAKQGTFMAVGCSAVITAVILFFGKYLMEIFTDTPDLVTRSVYIMRILAVGYIAMAVTQSLSGVMRGAGDTMTPMWISMISTIVIRIPLAYGLSYVLGELAPTLQAHNIFIDQSNCIQISLLISWVMGAVLTFLFYKMGKWKKIMQTERSKA